jgi:hypothetical protein
MSFSDGIVIGPKGHVDTLLIDDTATMKRFELQGEGRRALYKRVFDSPFS